MGKRVCARKHIICREKQNAELTLVDVELVGLCTLVPVICRGGAVQADRPLCQGGVREESEVKNLSCRGRRVGREAEGGSICSPCSSKQHSGGVHGDKNLRRNV